MTNNQQVVEKKDLVVIHFIGGKTLTIPWDEWRVCEKNFPQGMRQFQSFYEVSRNTGEQFYSDFIRTLNMNAIAYVEKYKNE